MKNTMKKLTVLAVIAALALIAGAGCSNPAEGGGPPPSSAKTITGFTVAGIAGNINAAAKTVTVTVPLSTATTQSPVITIDGASISPASGVSQNFAFLVPYTVTAEDGSKAQWIVTVKWESLEAGTNIGTYLGAASGGSTAADPVILPVNINLASGWAALLTAIQTGGKYVALDLSACTMIGTEFDPGTANTGEKYIVSLVLPNAMESIKAAPFNDSTFKHFTTLGSVTGANVTNVGGGAFQFHNALRSLSFPKAEIIGDNAFNQCTYLTSVDLPAATNIGKDAFFLCYYLTAVYLPTATNIGQYAFYGCDDLASVSLQAVETIGYAAFGFTALTSIDLPAALTNIAANPFPGCAGLTAITIHPGNPNYKAENGMLLSNDGTILIAYPSASGTLTTLPGSITTIGKYAFSYCETLTSVSLSTVETIDEYAFQICRALVSVSLPAVETIGQYAFDFCDALASINLPSVTSIWSDVFSRNYSQALTVTLGDTPPVLGVRMFNSVPRSGENGTKSVTVKVPASATGYTAVLPVTYTGAENTAGGPHWGEGFRGKGWTGGGTYEYGGEVNSNISLTIQTTP
jgi:hypothetical protein